MGNDSNNFGLFFLKGSISWGPAIDYKKNAYADESNSGNPICSLIHENVQFIEKKAILLD